jgi:hypothetical protein
MERWVIEVHGIVQGLGFRPFVYTLVAQHGLAGLVRNRPDFDAGVLRRNVQAVRPGMEVVEVSAKTGAGFGRWLETLGSRVAVRPGDRGLRPAEATGLVGRMPIRELRDTARSHGGRS